MYRTLAQHDALGGGSGLAFRRAWATCARVFLCLALLAWVLSAWGCIPPSIPRSSNDPIALQEIRTVYEKLVDEANNDPHVTWHSSWTGNMIVNQLGGEHRGLCYQWQDYVYHGVKSTVDRVGWSVTGLTVNEGNGFEHHCVIVWDPKVIRQDQILAKRGFRPVYVLDAWHDGKADVHWIDAWLDSQLPHDTPARLQELPVPMNPLPTPGPWEPPAENASLPQ